MKLFRKTFCLVVLAPTALSHALAQYAPPPPPAPFQGFINEALRKDNPYMNQWDFGGSVRLRYEVKDNFGIPGVPGSMDFRENGADVDNTYWMTRIRFRGGYTDKYFSALVEGRSSIVISDERWAYFSTPLPASTVNREGKGPESDTIDLHQAFVTLGNHKEFPLSLKVGRQELSYGEERLVGAFGWNNIGRVFDTAKMRWQNAWFAADFFTGRPVIPEDNRFNVANDYDWFSGAYATITKIPKHTLETYFFARNASQEAISAEPSPQFPQPSARDIYTLGLRLKSLPGQFGNWDYTLETAGQFGNFRDRRLGITSPRLDHQAYMGIVQGGYTFSESWGTPRVGLEYAYASGDSDAADGKHETFENLFPTNHKFYGYMDFFSLQNLHNVRGIFQIKPHPRLSMAIEAHGFWLADTHDNFYNVGGAPRGGLGVPAGGAGTGYGIYANNSNFVGAELDVIAGYALTRNAQLEVGYGHFFVGDYVRQSLSNAAFGSTDANYVYAQATINF
jgi:hypothetical protein